MKNESEEYKENNYIKKNSKMKSKNSKSNMLEQKTLNRTNFSDTIKILNLLKSCPSTTTSGSFQSESKLNKNNDNSNNNSYSNFNLNIVDNLTYEEIKAICLNIFLLYAKPINGQFYLKLRSIFRLLKELEIIKENCLSYVDIEILNQQINKRGDKLNSEQFLDLLAKICCLLDDSFYKDKKGSFIKLIKVYILPFYLKKYNKENKGSKFYCDETFNLSMNLTFKNLILVEFKLDQDSFDILTSIIDGLKIIYEIHFSYSELNMDKDYKKVHDKSFTIFIKFLKNFNIMPYLINQRLAELYWYLIISEEVDDLYKINCNDECIDKNSLKKFLDNEDYDMGKVYTFKKFFLLLSHISFYYYYPIKKKTNAQKLLYIIEKVYKSKGNKNLPNIYCKTFNKKYSIIPPVNIVEKIVKNVIENIEVTNSENKEELLKNFIELNEENFTILEKYLEPLKNIFDIYCQIYDRSQFGKMSFSNFHKLLFDGDLLLINDKIKQKNEEENENIIIDNTKSKNNKTGIKNIKIDNNLEKSKSMEISNLNKESYNQNDFSLKFNNSNTIKRKLKLTDLNIIISKICGNPNHINYQSQFNSKKPPNDSFKKKMILNSDFLTSNVDKSYRLDFILFLKSLVLISLKLYPNKKADINESMHLFLSNDIEQFISKLNKKCISRYPRNEQLNNLFKLISTSEEMIQLMDDIAPFINIYFDGGALNTEENVKKMDFKLFVQFFKEYEIYPLWINLGNLSDIFYTQLYRIKEEKNEININNIFKCDEKVDFFQFLECFILTGLMMNSGNDFDMIDKVLFLLDKMFSDNYGKVVKKIKNVQSMKDDYIFFEKILREKYPSYYERKYSNAAHRYDNKFYWVYEKNYANDKFTQQIDFGELFNKEKVKFEDVFDEGNNINTEDKKEENEFGNNNNETINEIKEE